MKFLVKIQNMKYNTTVEVFTKCMSKGEQKMKRTNFIKVAKTVGAVHTHTHTHTHTHVVLKR